MHCYDTTLLIDQSSVSWLVLVFVASHAICSQITEHLRHVIGPAFQILRSPNLLSILMFHTPLLSSSLRSLTPTTSSSWDLLHRSSFDGGSKRAPLALLCDCLRLFVPLSSPPPYTSTLLSFPPPSFALVFFFVVLSSSSASSTVFILLDNLRRVSLPEATHDPSLLDM